MKKDIHPNYNKQAKIVCACGNTMTTGSTSDEIHVEICSNCHPFYTGKQNLIDTAGRVEKFKKRTAASKTAQQVHSSKKEKYAKKKTKRQEDNVEK